MLRLGKPAALAAAIWLSGCFVDRIDRFDGGSQEPAADSGKVPARSCGDGHVDSTEECDPASPSSSPFDCSSECRRISAYTDCRNDASVCEHGTVCYLGMCSRPCEASTDCERVDAYPQLTVVCPIPKGNTCVVFCESDEDCPMPGARCNGALVCETE